VNLDHVLSSGLLDRLVVEFVVYGLLHHRQYHCEGVSIDVLRLVIIFISLRDEMVLITLLEDVTFRDGSQLIDELY